MRRVHALIALLASTVSLLAQVTVTTNDYAFAGAQSGRHVVRNSQGVLYAASIEEATPGQRPIVVHASYDGGATWTKVVSGGINDATTGACGSNPTNALSIAIDDQDRLHFRWGRFYYPSFFAGYYRWLDTRTGILGPTVDVHALVGAPATSRTTACNVATGPNGDVWITAPSTSSWRTQLLRSNLPYASNSTFTSVGVVSQTASAQSVRMAVDAAGNVHCAYYENTGTGDYRHRMYDAATGSWGTATDLGNLAAPNDYWGRLVCDILGNTHILCVRDSSIAPQIVYFRRDLAGSFTPPVTVASFTSAQLGSNNYHIVDLACDEVTGDVYVLYRDLAGNGGLRIDLKILTAPSFVPFMTLTPAASGQHEIYSPRLRGALWPAFDNTQSHLHATWRQGTAKPFDLKFMNVGGPNPMLATVTFSQPTVAPGVPATVFFDAPLRANETYVPLVSCTLGQTPLPGTGAVLPVVIDGCASYYLNDPLAQLLFPLTPIGTYFATLDGQGSAQGMITPPSFVPPGLNITFVICFVTVNGVNVTEVSQVGLITLL